MTTHDNTGWPGTPTGDSPNPTPTPDTPPTPATDTPQGGTGTHPSQERALSPEDEGKAVELAAAGVSYRRIGQLLGVSKNTAWRTVQRALREHHEEGWTNLKEFVARESLRLDRLDQTWLPRALRGEKDAAVVVLRTHTARVRLASAAGLVAAQKHQVTVNGGTGGVIDQEIQELLSKLALNDPQSAEGVE